MASWLLNDHYALTHPSADSLRAPFCMLRFLANFLRAYRRHQLRAVVYRLNQFAVTNTQQYHLYASTPTRDTPMSRSSTLSSSSPPTTPTSTSSSESHASLVQASLPPPLPSFPHGLNLGCMRSELLESYDPSASIPLVISNTAVPNDHPLLDRILKPVIDMPPPSSLFWLLWCWFTAFFCNLAEGSRCTSTTMGVHCASCAPGECPCVDEGIFIHVNLGVARDSLAYEARMELFHLPHDMFVDEYFNRLLHNEAVLQGALNLFSFYRAMTAPPSRPRVLYIPRPSCRPLLVGAILAYVALRAWFSFPNAVSS
ncbi:hypothetical protein C8F01DRAFT_1079954 [Mycena amicta]|nr:hypothetical protein C8F01DRAFT_1079954 [Mycena amicta]